MQSGTTEKSKPPPVCSDSVLQDQGSAGSGQAGLNQSGSGGYPARTPSPGLRSGNPFDFDEEQPAASQSYSGFGAPPELAQRGLQGDTLIKPSCKSSTPGAKDEGGPFDSYLSCDSLSNIRQSSVILDPAYFCTCWEDSHSQVPGSVQSSSTAC